MKIYAIQAIHHNLNRKFVATREIDEKSGTYRLKAIPTILDAGCIHDVPDELASEMLRLGAARELTTQERQLHALATRGARLEMSALTPKGF